MARRKQRVRVASERKHRLNNRSAWRKADKKRRKKTAARKPSGIYTRRNKVLRDMGYPSYKHYLKSDLWKTIRAHVIYRTPTCELCLHRDASQVHHQSYDRDTLEGRSFVSLVATCARCHRRVEIDRRGNKRDPEDVFRMTGKILKRREREACKMWDEANALDSELDALLAAF